MKTTRAKKVKVLKVTVMPRVAGIVWARRTFEEKAIRKKKAIAKIPELTVGC